MRLLSFFITVNTIILYNLDENILISLIEI